ncbi:unnamed protein product [Chrysodeixis includens]|uniref:UBC core domain-containing protein n=1 Tax=Chrysodeixis includens TaxID=689277 RepID=A0A9N8L1L2_CHRIL|nr:unnamed protein product [Chrysodeixis includens]
MAGQNPGSPTDFQYFYEDEVYKLNNRGQVVFGLVLENYEANSSDQESDIETPIQKGEIRVVWHPSGTERVISEKSVGLADRSLMPGDVVRRLIAGKDTQRGYCRDIIMTAALQIVGTKHVIPSVASERLQPLEEFTPDLAVCLDSWVGTSKAVHSKLRLVSAEGSRLEYPDLDTCPLEDYSMRRRRSTPYSSSEFYPGQVVYGPLGSLDNANWLHVTKEMKAARKHKMHDHKFTVEAVVTESVSVHWQCRALCTHPADPATPQQPKFLVEGDDLKNLKLLNVFEPCTLQVGDRNFLTIGPEDIFVSKKQWRKQQSKYYRSQRKQSRPSKKPSKTETNSIDHMPSRPKKRASSHRKIKHDTYSDEMEVDLLVDVLKDPVCPSIKIEPIGDVSLPMASSQDDAQAEEKNDSGISVLMSGLTRSHVRSPEPAREDTSLLNGDSKSDAALNDDDSDNWENTSSDGSDTDSGATWSSRCSSAASARGKRSPQLAVRLLRGKRLKRTVRRAPPAPPPRLGDRVVVETLHTTSRANVVWQDGTIEMGIPSTQLYPIHHLDGQECFPGDFVVSGAANIEENQQLKHREYGVVQRVDHHGRTAIVHWYRTYTSADEPVPQMLNESEVSVYDLKDHPDFQYRPGTVVIRVANFTGEDANCTAGQVIDNFPSGRVKVWWVDGHTSMCWPQDLYKVGEYDSEEGELWGSEGSGSEDSWETQSSAHDAEPRTPDPLPPTPPDQPPHIGMYTQQYITVRQRGGRAVGLGGLGLGGLVGDAEQRARRRAAHARPAAAHAARPAAAHRYVHTTIHYSTTARRASCGARRARARRTRGRRRAARTTPSRARPTRCRPRRPTSRRTSVCTHNNTLQYDSEEGELWGSEGSGSEDSWETQSSAHDAEPRTPDPLPPTPPDQPPHIGMYTQQYITVRQRGGRAVGLGGLGLGGLVETQSSPPTPTSRRTSVCTHNNTLQYDSEEGEQTRAEQRARRRAAHARPAAAHAARPAAAHRYVHTTIHYSTTARRASCGARRARARRTRGRRRAARTTPSRARPTRCRPRRPTSRRTSVCTHNNTLQYDSEEGELWGSEGSGSEDSWETQSSAHDAEPRTPDPLPPTPPDQPPHIVLCVGEGGLAAAGVAGSAGEGAGVPRLLEPRVAAHIERGRIAMRKLEEMFAKHPTLQSQEVKVLSLLRWLCGAGNEPVLLQPHLPDVLRTAFDTYRELRAVFDKDPAAESREIMRKLLNLYKDCRFLDRLMGTSFFHEDHFLGLLERVRERGASTPRAGERRVHEQLARLFAPPAPADSAPAPAGLAPPALPAPLEPEPDAMLVDDDLDKPVRAIITANVTVEPMQVENSVIKKPLHLNIEPALATGSDTLVTQDNATSENPCAETNDGDQGPGRNVCYKLCSLIHAQLIKAHAEVSRRRPQELADFLNSLMKKQNATEENLVYHFSVQYGALVVSLAEEDKGEAKAADVKDATTATQAKTDGGSDTAPLATAEGTEEAEMETVPPMVEDQKEGGEGFCILESAPAGHRFRLSMLQPSEPRTFYSAVKREIKLLKSDLPPGVWVRGYEDRIDLLSVMIAGPTKTPYEGGLFVFDVQLGGEYPRAPPLCHYHSYCTDRLNPNLYEDGKVCVSLLGTWSGRGVEVWGKDSSLLQVIVSLQGLILNAEPYFNEAGYEKQKGTQQGKENSRMYNEMVLLKLVQSMTKMATRPPEPFREEILSHLRGCAGALCSRLEALVSAAPGPAPDYPLLPASRGFCLTLRSSLAAFRAALRRALGASPPPASPPPAGPSPPAPA